MHIVEFLFLLLAASLVFITLFKYLRLPTLFGYLLLGIFLGPYGMEFIKQEQNISEIAELGIMALMFTLGLKFSITKLASSRRYVFQLGGLQVASCMTIATLLSHFLLGFGWHDSLLFGSIIAMSSTAVISKLLIDRGEVSTPHGTRSVAVLIFQDLAVIPLLIFFSHDANQTDQSLITLFLTATAVIFVLVFIAPYLMPRIVDFFAKQQSNEIFTVFVLCLVSGISLLTHLAGLSMVLGSFLTGMLLSESRHRYLIEDIIRPYREIFLGFFFVSIGLLLVPNVFRDQWLLILCLSLVVLLIKPMIIYVIARRMNSHIWTASQVAISLGGTGEFGFVLLTAATTVSDNLFLQVMLAVNLVCMVTPTMALGLLRRMRSRSKSDWLLQARDLTRIVAQVGAIDNHVIVIGYGQNGRVIVKLLDKRKIPWIAVDNNYERSKAAGTAGVNVVYGDARTTETLIALGIFKAKSLIITHGIQSAAVQTVQAAHGLCPSLPITVKVLGHSEIKEVHDAGASYLSVAAIESGATMAARAMQEYGVSNQAIAHDIRSLHDDVVKYGGGHFLMDSTVMDAMANDAVMRPFVLEVTDESIIYGKAVTTLLELIKDTQAEFLYIERNDQQQNPDSDLVLQDGDKIVLRGNQFDLDITQALLLHSD